MKTATVCSNGDSPDGSVRSNIFNQFYNDDSICSIVLVVAMTLLSRSIFSVISLVSYCWGGSVASIFVVQ